MSFFIHIATYLFSAPLAKYASNYFIAYIGVTQAFVPVCVEMSSYIIVRPIHAVVVQPMLDYAYNVICSKLQNHPRKLLT